MNNLDYSLSLREKGLGTEEIKAKLKDRGLEDAEIQYYLKKSDEIFLNQTDYYRRSRSRGKSSNDLKTLALVLSLILLVGVFYGYARIGLLGLFIIWVLIGYSSFRR